MRRIRARSDRTDIWPGFVDALSALLMVIIFVLLIFVLAQFVLSNALTGKDAALTRLQAELNSLTEALALERSSNAELRQNLAGLSAELDQAITTRDELARTLADVQSERDALAGRIAALTSRAEEGQARIAELEADLAEAREMVAADRETIELHLAEIESLRRDLTALRQVRDELEARVGELAANLEGARTALRDRTQALEARLAEAEERTALAQREVAERDIRLEELTALLAARDQALDTQRDLSRAAQAEVSRLETQMALLRQELARLNEVLEASEATIAEQQVQIADLGRQLNRALASKVAELARYRSEFFGRLREVLGDRPGIRIVGDRFVFQSEVLFPSASATLQAGGRREMEDLAATLNDIIPQIPDDIDWVLRVDGHTDDLPIATPEFPSNWELSAARAIEVVRFLVAQGVPADRLAATGFAEYQPIVTNAATPDERRRNRRIEFKLTTR